MAVQSTKNVRGLYYILVGESWFGKTFVCDREYPLEALLQMEASDPNSLNPNDI